MSRLLELVSEVMSVQLDEARGVIRAIRDPREEVDASYLADGGATYKHELGGDELFLGDVVLRTSVGGSWALRSTARSGEVRRCLGRSGQACSVEYNQSAAEGGLNGLSVREEFALQGPALVWRVEVTNVSGQPVEVGELSFPFPLNNDLNALFGGQPLSARSSGELQRVWHEERVAGHLHVGGHSSYLLVQRPSGRGRLLCVVPVDQTAVEVAYQVEPDAANQWSNVFEGPYFLSVHSRAARQLNGWLANRQRQNCWLMGASSRVIEPGEAYRLGFRFSFIEDPEQLRAGLLNEGRAYIEAAPGFVVPLGHVVQLAVSSPTTPVLRPEADGVAIEETGQAGEQVFMYRLRFATPGQKIVRVTYGEASWTKVALFVTDAPRSLLERRASFICARQFYRNPYDPFGRNHAFLPYDDDVQAVYLDSEESWQVGASDEYGLPVAMFLAEKNVHLPVAEEVATLEKYVDSFLLGNLQDPHSLDVRRGLAYVDQLPSTRPHEWAKEYAADTRRFNNYPLVANIYHALAKLAERYGLTKSRSAAEYLTLAWKTAVRGFEVGLRGGRLMPIIGAPAGTNLLDLLRYCQGRDPEGFEALDAALRRFADEAAVAQYPYGSELYVDQTAHAQLYAAMEHYGHPEALERTVSALKALRWGFQPSWFRYGNDLRGSVCCWYGTPQNSEVLLREFRKRGDPRLLKQATAGLASFLTSVRSDGASHGWFTWWPDRAGFDTRSLDTDMGLYAYLRAAGAYVVRDPLFGLVGYGCTATEIDGGAVCVVPDNGVDEAVYFVPGVEVVASRGLSQVTMGPDRHWVEVEVPGDGFGAPEITVRGLAGEITEVTGGSGLEWSTDGDRVVVHGGSEQSHSDEPLRVRMVAR